MAYYDVAADYDDVIDRPETETPNTSYDADISRQFLCNGAGRDPSCDFGYCFPSIIHFR